MAVYQNESYTNETIKVDGNRYEACRFTNCVLVYRGGELPGFVRCAFPGTAIQLEEGAYQTLETLNRLYLAGAFGPIDRLIENILTGQLATPDRPNPPPRSHTGNNWGETAFWHGAVAVFTLLVVWGLWYGYLIYPNGVLEEGEPLAVEYPLEGMPDLPDQLAAAYDAFNADQAARLFGFGWVDEEAQIVRIPLDEAYNILLGEGAQPVLEGGEDNAEAAPASDEANAGETDAASEDEAQTDASDEESE